MDKPNSQEGETMELPTKHNEFLERLPVKVIRARVIGTREYKDVLVDGDYDGEYYATLPWAINPSGNVYTWYYERDASKKTKQKYLHNFVLPSKRGLWVVHLNGNKLDNRSCNLAYLTPKEAIALRDKRWGGTPLQRAMINGFKRFKRGGISISSYIGVHHDYYKKPDGSIKYVGYTTRFREKYHGFFHDEEAAARKYDELAKEYYGDRAVLNFPEKQDE